MPSQIDNTFHALMYYFIDIVNTWCKKYHVQKLSKFKFQNKKNFGARSLCYRYNLKF